MRVSFWLVPAEPQREELSGVIRRLASQFDAPMFLPHVTLYSGRCDVTNDIGMVLDTVARLHAPLELKTSGISISDAFTKTVFVELASTQVLATLSDDLKAVTMRPADYELNPHLSLIYAQLPVTTKQRLAREISVPPTLRFDAITAMIGGEPTQTRQDVEDWVVWRLYKLTGKTTIIH